MNTLKVAAWTAFFLSSFFMMFKPELNETDLLRYIAGILMAIFFGIMSKKD